MPDMLHLKLREAIRLDDTTYEQLELYEPTAGHLAEAEKVGLSAHESNIKLISLCARVPLALASKLPATEYAQAVRWLQAPLATGPKTGGEFSGV